MLYWLHILEMKISMLMAYHIGAGEVVWKMQGIHKWLQIQASHLCAFLWKGWSLGYVLVGVCLYILSQGNARRQPLCSIPQYKILKGSSGLKIGLRAVIFISWYQQMAQSCLKAQLGRLLLFLFCGVIIAGYKTFLNSLCLKKLCEFFKGILPAAGFWVDFLLFCCCCFVFVSIRCWKNLILFHKTLFLPLWNCAVGFFSGGERINQNFCLWRVKEGTLADRISSTCV